MTLSAARREELDRAAYDAVYRRTRFEPAELTNDEAAYYDEALAAMRGSYDTEADRITTALDKLVLSRRPFTVDQLWARFDDINPAAHRSWLGRYVQELEDDGDIAFVEWRETPRSLPHSRPTRVWRGLTNAERKAKAA